MANVRGLGRVPCPGGTNMYKTVIQKMFLSFPEEKRLMSFIKSVAMDGTNMKKMVVEP